MSKPNITIPTEFATNGVKTDFTAAKILDGFDRINPDVLAGDNLNKFIDDTYKGLNGTLELFDGCVLYDSNISYNDTSIVFNIDSDNKVKIYHSLINNNLGNSLTDDTKWEEVGFADIDLSNITNIATTKIAHNAMPSETYTDLTLGASGSTYTMPADGYLNYVLLPQSNDMWFELRGLLGTGSYAGGSNTYGYHGFMPVKKGEVVTIAYTNCNTSLLRFIYAVGSAWEA